MVVIRRPFHRFFFQCIEAAGAGRGQGCIAFVAAFLRSKVYNIYVAVVARLLAPFPDTDEG